MQCGHLPTKYFKTEEGRRTTGVTCRILLATETQALPTKNLKDAKQRTRVAGGGPVEHLWQHFWQPAEHLWQRRRLQRERGFSRPILHQPGGNPCHISPACSLPSELPCSFIIIYHFLSLILYFLLFISYFSFSMSYISLVVYHAHVLPELPVSFPISYF